MTPNRWWINGTLIPADMATIGADDHGLTVGDGCFETTSVVRGQPFALRRHLTRLRHSLDGLGLELSMSDDELRHATQEVVAANPDAGVIRITVTAGSGPLGSGRSESELTVLIAVGPHRPWPPTASVVTVPWPRNERGALAGVKSTSYAENVVALAYAHRHQASEAIFANTVGELCEGTGTNIFVVVDGRLATPPLRSGCLDGVTRQLVLETNDVDEIDLPFEILDEVDEAFLTSSTRNVMPIDHINERPLTTGVLTEAAARQLARLIESTVDP